MIILIIVVVVVLSFLIQILLISDLSVKIATFLFVSKNCICHQVSLLRQQVLHNILVWHLDLASFHFGDISFCIIFLWCSFNTVWIWCVGIQGTNRTVLSIYVEMSFSIAQGVSYQMVALKVQVSMNIMRICNLRELWWWWWVIACWSCWQPWWG